VAGQQDLRARRWPLDLPLSGFDSAGETIDFMLSPKRDALAAKHFLQLAL